jgi:glycosyltransferase involved in cell wall biosynthesis
MSAYNVQVFLSTYNGEKYLKEQIDSLLKQKNVHVSILVRDDGSQDSTKNILEEYQKEGKISYYQGNNLGYSKSFLDLVNTKAQADFYAFCDQDDIWLPEKIITGIKKIEQAGDDESKPILYASALQRVDALLNPLAIQNFPNLRLTLGAEFIRHRLAGCTYIFNNALRNLLQAADGGIASHDKMAAILCLACGGQIIFDESPHILFRRHESNTSSDGENIKNKIIKTLFQYFGKCSNTPQLAQFILTTYDGLIIPEARDLISEIAYYKNNFVNTLKLTFSPHIDCGVWFYNLFIRIIILLRLF